MQILYRYNSTHYAGIAAWLNDFFIFLKKYLSSYRFYENDTVLICKYFPLAYRSFTKV